MKPDRFTQHLEHARSRQGQTGERMMRLSTAVGGALVRCQRQKLREFLQLIAFVPDLESPSNVQAVEKLFRHALQECLLLRMKDTDHLIPRPEVDPFREQSDYLAKHLIHLAPKEISAHSSELQDWLMRMGKFLADQTFDVRLNHLGNFRASLHHHYDQPFPQEVHSVLDASAEITAAASETFLALQASLDWDLVVKKTDAMRFLQIIEGYSKNKYPHVHEWYTAIIENEDTDELLRELFLRGWIQHQDDEDLPFQLSDTGKSVMIEAQKLQTGATHS